MMLGVAAKADDAGRPVRAQCALIRGTARVRAFSNDPRCKSAHEFAEVAAHGISAAAVMQPEVDAEIDVVG